MKAETPFMGHNFIVNAQTEAADSLAFHCSCMVTVYK